MPVQEILSCVNVFKAVTYFPIRLSLSGVRLRSLIHLDLSFEWGNKYWIYLPSLTCRHPIRPTSFAGDTLPVSLYCFGFFVKNQVSVGALVYFLVFNSIALIHLSVSIPVLSRFYCYFSEVSLRSGIVVTPRYSFY